jgi:hypothetical protein
MSALSALELTCSAVVFEYGAEAELVVAPHRGWTVVVRRGDDRELVDVREEQVAAGAYDFILNEVRNAAGWLSVPAWRRALKVGVAGKLKSRIRKP